MFTILINLNYIINLLKRLRIILQLISKKSKKLFLQTPFKINESSMVFYFSKDFHKSKDIVFSAEFRYLETSKKIEEYMGENISLMYKNKKLVPRLF